MTIKEQLNILSKKLKYLSNKQKECEHIWSKYKETTIEQYDENEIKLFIENNEFNTNRKTPKLKYVNGLERYCYICNKTERDTVDNIQAKCKHDFNKINKIIKIRKGYQEAYSDDIPVRKPVYEEVDGTQYTCKICKYQKEEVKTR